MTADYIIVGSGINSLVCAAMLAKKGHSVIVLERNTQLGGCIRSEEITVPGFMHDVLSGFHPLFVTSPAYAALKDDLHGAGLEYVNTDCPTGIVLPDGRSFILKTSREENVAAMNVLHKRDGDFYQKSMADLEQNSHLTFGLLGNEMYSWSTLKLLGTELFKKGPQQLLSFFGGMVDTCRGWLEGFDSELLRACFAPWILHTGLGPESTLSGSMDRLICFTLEVAGMPIVKGGSHKFVEAFQKVIENNGGKFVVGADVEQIIIEDSVAKGVTTSEGQSYTANKAVICNVTPTQLYNRLLTSAPVPEKVRDQAEAYRYGRGDMQIHIALDEPPDWADPELAKVAMLHLTSGLEGVSKAVNEAERGLLPETATIVLAQPTALDPSRAPEGKGILWVQLQELPRVIKGDAAGEITIPEDGTWTEAVKEAYADRIIDRIALHIPNLKTSMLARTVLSPADLQALNINLVGGDPYSGSCSIDQFFMWRPLRATKNHSTPIKQLYHIGASTHPGPGLGGVSGYLVAKALS